MNPPTPLTTGQVVAAAQNTYDAACADMLNAGAALAEASNAHYIANNKEFQARKTRTHTYELLQLAITEDAKSRSASVLAFGASLD